tara:strand:- start:413 stop:601 length:189 start_codon:yes stop_codon:yes gene_type:complete
MEDLSLSSIVKELEHIKIDLQHTLDRVDGVLMNARILAEGKKVEFTDIREDFSEKKERFIAP